MQTRSKNTMDPEGRASPTPGYSSANERGYAQRCSDTQSEDDTDPMPSPTRSEGYEARAGEEGQDTKGTPEGTLGPADRDIDLFNEESRERINTHKHKGKGKQTAHLTHGDLERGHQAKSRRILMETREGEVQPHPSTTGEEPRRMVEGTPPRHRPPVFHSPRERPGQGPGGRVKEVLTRHEEVVHPARRLSRPAIGPTPEASTPFEGPYESLRGRQMGPMSPVSSPGSQHSGVGAFGA